MKTLIKALVFLLMFICLLGLKGARAGDEFKKVVRKEFRVNPDAQLTINNRFGKVHITEWDKNALTIEVTITVEASDQESADKRLSKISIDFSDSPTLVSATTMFDNDKTPSKGHFSIDYMVSMPVTGNLDVTNKFGDIFINELQGKARIDLSYGNLDARKLDNSDNLLDIKFGKARVNSVKGAVLNLKYSQMSLDYAGSIRLNSKYSDLDAEKIIALNVLQEGGKLEMEKSSAVESRSKFTDINIQRVDFTSISIRNKYGDVTIGLDEQAKYQLEAELKFCNLEYPENNAKFSFRSTTPTEKTYKGIVGGSESPKSKVVVKSEFGNVRLK